MLDALVELAKLLQQPGQHLACERRQAILGITQYMAASTHHPALKAIMPEVALIDLYDVIYPGGIYRQDFMERWGGLTRDLVSASAPDADFYALLEEVDASGRSNYVSEGVLRASHREMASPPWDNLGLSWHRSFAADLEPLRPGEVVELRFDIHPLAHLFNRGHRMRITIMGADAGNTETPPSPDAVIKLHFGGRFPSRIEFPVLAAPARGDSPNE